MSLHFAFLLHVLVCFAGCYCDSKTIKYIKDPAFDDWMCPQDQVDSQTVTRSAVTCAQKCSASPGCESLVYLHGNNTCFGIRSEYPFTASSPIPGAKFYKPTPAIPSTPMALGLPNSQYTASSFISVSHEPWQARFNTTIKGWCPASQTTNQWLQVDFSTLILATHVLTKGRPDRSQWVTSYKLLTSPDCSPTNFIHVKDHLGNDKIFSGNVDRDSPVQHALDPPVVCLCFRINPRTWYARNIFVRLEVQGHVI